MDPICDFCGQQVAVVYCQSDTARLCLSCDKCIHLANALSQRHVRSLVCDICCSQPAIVRCLEERVLLCKNCECWWKYCGPTHRRQVVNSYSGCPSSLELLILWSGIIDGLDLGDVDSSCGSCMMTVNENCVSNYSLNGSSSPGKLESWIGSSSVLSDANLIPYGGNQQVFLQELNPSEDAFPPFKGHGVCNDDDFCEGINIDDVDLNFQSSGELFGCKQSHLRYVFEDVGMNGLLMENNFTVANSNRPNVTVTEATSSGQRGCMGLQSSHVLGMASAIEAVASSVDPVRFDPGGNRNFNPNFPSVQVPSSVSLSVSRLADESTVSDYQDCGISPMFLTAETAWDPNLEKPSPQARDKAKMRYHEKKKNRAFGRQIRYASRKARADTRKHVKG